MNNTHLIRSFINDAERIDYSSGRTIFNDNGTETKGFALTNHQKKQLDKLCSEADCKERWSGKPVDVVVVKQGDIVTFSLKERA
jgi:hypothetical protein